MEPTTQTLPERGVNLPTLFWMAGCGFILAATVAFVAYLRFHLPWWAMAVALGLCVGIVVFGLEHFVARPLERLARGLAAPVQNGELQVPPSPNHMPAPLEVRLIWRGLRIVQDLQGQTRLTQQSHDSRIAAVQRQTRILTLAGRSLRPESPIEQNAPVLLRDLATLLGVPAVYLVPLRRHTPVGVMGAAGTPDWADAVRATGLGPWRDALRGNVPIAMSLTSRAPGWANAWARRTLWVVPLVYHERALGVLLALPSSGERAFTSEELALLEAIAPMLAAALHPPRWSEERKRRIEERRREVEAGSDVFDDEDDEDDDEPESRRARRRRQRQGAQ